MKYLIGLSLLIMTSSYANTTTSAFKKDSALPLYLKSQMLEELAAQYPCINPNGISEIKTIAAENLMGQGKSQIMYSTTLRVNFTYDYHPRSATLEVLSSELKQAKEQLEFYQIDSIEGDIYCD